MKVFGAVAAMAILTATSAAAQYAGAPPTPPQTVQNHNEPNLDQERLKSDALKRVKAAPSHEQILHDAVVLVKSINLNCEVTDASLLNDGTATVNGKPLHVRTFETACSNGLGYFLIEQPPEATYGFTCLAADAAHTADIAAKRDPQPACSLAANADVKKTAANVLGRLGQQCQVTGLRLIGRDTKANAELSEIACTGGNGFVISSPMPGATQAVSALSCPDSYRSGIPCRLSSNGAPLVTMETFKQALAQHKVACTVENARSVGRQNSSKRHVVEFKCPEQPNGLVAFIALEDATAPFEVMDCPTAGNKAHIICTLTQIH